MPRYSSLKRLLDFCFAAVVLLLLAPLLITVAVAIKVFTPGRIFYRQTRIGHHCAPFELLKFRTMTENPNRDLDAELNPADPEITRIGHYLRRFKIDELPQLFNVLLGDMSLVGPRPPLPLLLTEMTDTEKRRFDVLPGLTGLAQVNGNIHLSWKERFLHDLTYVGEMSLLLDIRILLKTVLIVLFGEEKFINKSKHK